MSKWKPVALDTEGIFNDIEGLVGIEVLDSTEAPEIVKGKKTLKRKTNDPSSSNAKKRKTVNTEDVGSLASKPEKKKKKKKKVIEEKVDEEEESKAEDSDDDVEVVDIRSQMSSWESFGLRLEILQALHEKKFFEPTQIQHKCIMAAMTAKDRDIVGAAETGSGKTYAFGIPIVHSILNHLDSLSEKEKKDENRDHLEAVVVAPTRELAVQVKNHLTDLCKFTSINVALVVGGLAKEKQTRILKKRPEIVVGTPGRLWELYNDEGNPHLRAIPRIRMLVIDEADRMLEAQHFAELGHLLERMNDDDEISSRRRNFIFSATLTFVHELPSYHKGKKQQTSNKKISDLLTRIGVKQELLYDLSKSKMTPDTLREWKITCQFDEKDCYLIFFLQQNPGRAIIFCNSIGSVRRLANLLSIVKLKPLPLHANMEQKHRLKNMEKFRDSPDGLLLATDVAARGLDIPQVAHVVHYQVPRTAESYVHRSGRTARQTRTGVALLLVCVEEVSQYKKLMKSLHRDSGVDTLDVPLQELNQVKKIVLLARDVDAAILALKKSSATEKWYEKAIEEMDIIVDDDERPEKSSTQALRKLKQELAAKEKELNKLLTAPSLPKGFSGLFPDMNVKRQPKKRRTIKQE